MLSERRTAIFTSLTAGTIGALAGFCLQPVSRLVSGKGIDSLQVPVQPAYLTASERRELELRANELPRIDPQEMSRRYDFGLRETKARDARLKEYLTRVSLTESEVGEIISKYGGTINNSQERVQIHQILRETPRQLSRNAVNDCLGDLTNFFKVVSDINESGDFQVLDCSRYVFYYLRRESPEEFINPHFTPEPIGVLKAQGYEPISFENAQDGDVVLYFSRSESGERPFPSHWGMIRCGKVTSKWDHAPVVRHTIELEGAVGAKFLVFRSNHPIPDFINDSSLSDQWHDDGEIVLPHPFSRATTEAKRLPIADTAVGTAVFAGAPVILKRTRRRDGSVRSDQRDLPL